MREYDSFFNLLFSNLKKLFYPEEWLSLDFSFSKSEIFAMMIVERHGEIIVSQMADYLNIPMSTSTGIIDRLVKKGYMLRERSETDRRIVVIKLTDKGKEIVAKIKETITNYLQLINSSLTDEEREVLYSIFLKVIDKLGNKKENEGAYIVKENRIRKIEIE